VSGRARPAYDPWRHVILVGARVEQTEVDAGLDASSTPLLAAARTWLVSVRAQQVELARRAGEPDNLSAVLAQAGRQPITGENWCPDSPMSNCGSGYARWPSVLNPDHTLPTDPRRRLAAGRAALYLLAASRSQMQGRQVWDE
jgi:hypothetical protein